MLTARPLHTSATAAQKAGNWTVFSAAYSDRFAERPALFAQINAADQVYGNVGHLTGLAMGTASQHRCPVDLLQPPLLSPAGVSMQQ